MRATVYSIEDGYAIRGEEPPGLRAQPEAVRLLFWGWVVEEGLRQKDRDLAQGLDKDGKPLRRIKASTRKHRHSAMTPTGRGDPSAPPLEPGRQKSRVRSLLTGRAYPDHAAFWWKYDAFTGESFAEILRHQKDQGRDVFGLSPAALKRTMARAWEKFRRWEAGKTVELPRPITIPQARRIEVAGTTDLSLATTGIGMPARPGQWAGGMRIEDWIRRMREPAKVAIPGRPGSNYNRLLEHVWGGQEPPRQVKAGKGGPKKPPAPAAPKPAFAFEAVGNLPARDADRLRATVEAMPAPVLATLERAGVRFVVGEKFADLDAGLARETPRGWPAGLTWANSDGIHMPGRKTVAAFTTHVEPHGGRPVPSPRVEGVLRHETGHAFDDAIGGASFYNDDWTRAYRQDVAAIGPADAAGLAYYLQRGAAGPQETFAELFGQLLGGGSRPTDITRHFPECTKLMREWIARGTP